MDLPCVFGAFARARRMVKQLKKPTGDGAASTAADPSATAKVAATSVLVKNMAKPAESSIRKKCYVIFEGTASQSLRAAFARRPDWRDGTAAHNDAVGDEARPPCSASHLHHWLAEGRTERSLPRGNATGQWPRRHLLLLATHATEASRHLVGRRQPMACAGGRVELETPSPCLAL